jgi:ABC-2 type transport system ATP-binding protein
MADDIAIKVEHVSKNFVLPHEKVTSVKSAFTGMLKRGKTKESQHALKDVSFEVKKGEFFGIVGRNGSGKSTMLKILAGIYQPTTGSVHTYGKLVPFIELGVGFNPELTGRENVYLNGAMLGFSKKEIDSMYSDIVAFAELERFMDQKLKNYSSGMQVRLAFSMATRSEADILLVDEVLAVGDADFQRKCFDYFRQLKRNKKTVVFVSHDMSAIREYCDRAIMIEKSEIIESGEAEKIADKYTKLFTEEMEADESSSAVKEERRWGNEHAQASRINILPKRLISKTNELIISTDVVAKRAASNLIVGFVIKSPDGRMLFGTNTKVEKVDTGSWKEGQAKNISWTVPHIFRDGLHSIDIAILENDAITVCDWLEDADTFRAYDERRLPYIVSPVVETKIKEGTKG